MAAVEKLVTAEEFLHHPDDGRITELVRGKVVVTNPPFLRHGRICSNVVRILGGFVEQRQIGITASNDTGIITQRDPDTVRGADVAFYSFERLPKGADPEGYAGVAPELVFEVLSPNDRWPEITAKVGEHLAAGVLAVCVLDPQSRTASVHDADRPPEKLTHSDKFQLPDILPGFAVSVSRLFE